MPPVTSEQVQQLIIATIAIQVAIPFAKWSAEKWFTRFEKTDDDLSKAYAQLSTEVHSEIKSLSQDIKGLGQLLSEVVGDNREHKFRVSQVERISEEFRESLKEHREELKREISEVRDEVRELAERVK